MNAGRGPRLVLKPVRIAIAVAALVAVAVLLIVLIGKDPEEQITEVTLAYGAAEGADACEYLSSEALEQIGGAEGCNFTFKDVRSAEFEVQEISVDGDTATAEVLNVDSGTPIDLGYVEEDGDWRISSFPGLEQVVPTDQAPPSTAPEATETEGQTETDASP